MDEDVLVDSALLPGTEIRKSVPVIYSYVIVAKADAEISGMLKIHADHALLINY